MRQKWGQNFLVREDAACRIVEGLGLVPTDRVVEIGPGRGALTRYIRGQVAELTAVELDARLAATLRRRWAETPEWKVVNRDFLEWPLPAWSAGAGKVVGNLPYSAAGAILRRFLEWPGWSVAVVMVQREVGRRMESPPDGADYGILSLAVQIYAEVERLFDVPPSFFSPPPKVFSTVIRLRRRTSPLVTREKPFFDVVRAAFGQRRKTLLNSLSHGLEREKAEVEAVLFRHGIDGRRRAETLDWREFDAIAGGLFPA